MREVLGGGSGGRWYADGEDTIHVVPDSRNLPTEFTESRFPLRVERLGLAVDSGGPGRYRGGCGYEKHIRVLRDEAERRRAGEAATARQRVVRAPRAKAAPGARRKGCSSGTRRVIERAEGSDEAVAGAVGAALHRRADARGD